MLKAYWLAVHLLPALSASSPAGPPAQPLEVHRLAGPYPSLPAVARRVKRDWDASRCKSGPVAARQAASGAIEAAWLRCEVSVAGARGTDCALAVRSAKGWYADGEHRLRCGGRLGALSSVQARFDTPNWNDGVLWATFDVETMEGEWSERPEGGKAAVSPRPDKNRWLILCSAGPSGVPSCSEPLVLGCSSGDSSATVSARLRRHRLVLTGKEEEGCDRGNILLGTFRLDFR